MSLKPAPPRPVESGVEEPVDWRQATALFVALSHPGRLAVFRALCQAGHEGILLADLASLVRTTGSALTFHLRALESAGLVRTRPRSVYGRPAIGFVASPEPLLALVRLTVGAADKNSQ